MDSESKDTADRHEAEDRGPDGLSDRREKHRAVSRYKEKKERGKFLSGE